MRAGVGEAHLQSAITCEFSQNLRTMIGNCCAPTYCGTMLNHQVEKCVDRVQPAALHSNLPERLADYRGVRTGNDLGVEEVAMPSPGSVLAVVILAELAPIALVSH